MKVVTAAQMAALDQQAIREIGIPGSVLMETAGRALAHACARRWPQARKVLVVCGPGNNGGDGFVAARTLLDLGWDPVCLLLGPMSRLGGDAALHASVFQRVGGQVLEVREGEPLPAANREVDLVVDALFGTGLRRPLEGLSADLVAWMNALGIPIAAADMPSGICSDTGRELGQAVRATLTVTMGLPKRGLFLYPGAACAGEILVAEIGLPARSLRSDALPGELLERHQVQGLLPQRPPTAHKGTCGSVLVLGGSRRYPGAPFLAAEAALRVGAGLAVVACPGEIRFAPAAGLREILTIGLPSPHGVVQPDDLSELLPLDPKVRALCLGPGLSEKASVREAIRALLAKTDLPVVLDADALRSIAGGGPLRTGGVLTPHPGEMAALLGVPLPELETDRVGSALRCAREYRAVVVFKGAPTIVADPDGERYWINTSGGPVLAQGGTGDVLAGAVAGLLAQGLTPSAAARAGVFLHGQAGDLCASEQGPRGVLAGEVARALPRVLARALECHPRGSCSRQPLHKPSTLLEDRHDP